MKNEISRLRQYHSEQRDFVVNLLNEGNSYLLSIVNALEQKFGPTMLLGHEVSRLPGRIEIGDAHMRIQTLMVSVVSDLYRIIKAHFLLMDPPLSPFIKEGYLNNFIFCSRRFLLLKLKIG